jgi:tetratricopeptide (TPR) repeat protein
MSRNTASLALLLALTACGEAPVATAPAVPAGEFAGSQSCRECHERFYELWAPSHHGKAMQPFTPELARSAFTAQAEDILADGSAWRYEGDSVRQSGPDGETRHEIAHVMGGKNVYFLLTPRDRGRLQVLPVAYDVNEKRWYDTTASMVRHAAGHPDEPVPWTDPLLTFNTSCWSCHVSQLSVNYDAPTDTYHSAWAEPGINCETCHGSGAEHVRVCRAAGDAVPADLKIISMGAMTPTQRNDTCAPCHAKAVVLGGDFGPGDRYFDHFDLVCLESPDFYPDGIDLGENYTMTGWHMNPCVEPGGLDCLHCHTSSGRYRFVDSPNDACLPCHAERVANAPAHTRHEPDSPGNHCVACHMPTTAFARMRRSDHSMRPPAPALSAVYGSPNACTICHEDQDDAWADQLVREWRRRDYQAPRLAAAALIAAARDEDWTDLDAMLTSIAEGDEVHATSMIRLLAACPDPRKIPVLIEAIGHTSPLVRAAAAAGLRDAPDAVGPLLDAAGDDSRLVRIRAAAALAAVPLDAEAQGRLRPAMAELEASLTVRPDDWTSHYNLGNLHEQRGELAEAVRAYETASRLRPDAVAPWVNASIVHARLGAPAPAEKALRRALEADPDSPEAHYNLGLLLAELGRRDEAADHLRRAFEIDETLAGAAYNLAVLAAERDLDAALQWARRAYLLRPDDARYAQAYEYYRREAARQ